MLFRTGRNGATEQVMVDYIGVSDITRLVREIGAGNFIERLAAEIAADYCRWC